MDFFLYVFLHGTYCDLGCKNPNISAAVLAGALPPSALCPVPLHVAVCSAARARVGM